MRIKTKCVKCDAENIATYSQSRGDKIVARMKAALEELICSQCDSKMEWEVLP